MPDIYWTLQRINSQHPIVIKVSRHTFIMREYGTYPKGIQTVSSVSFSVVPHSRATVDGVQDPSWGSDGCSATVFHTSPSVFSQEDPLLLQLQIAALS